jgi:hypothetical protein
MPRSRKDNWKPGKWYRDQIAADRARTTREFTTAPRAMSAEADRKAITYAHWLLKRDGVELDAIAERFKAEHNAKHPSAQRKQGRRSWIEANRNAIPEHTETAARVVWHSSAAGMRPHFVEFYWDTHSRTPAFHSIELPNWAYEAGEAIDLSEREDIAA